MSAKTRWAVTIAASIAVMVGMIPAASAASDGVLADQAGDANGSGTVNAFLTSRAPEEGTVPGTAPFSYGPADLRRIWFTTDYVEVPREDGVVEYQPTGFTLHVVTEEEFDATGPTVLFRILFPISDRCKSEFLIERAGGTLTSGEEDQFHWGMDDDCDPALPESEDPLGETGTGYANDSWEIVTSGTELTVTIPYDTLLPWQQDLVALGRTITDIQVRSQIDVGVFPYVDGTDPTGHFTVGADAPQSSSS